MGLNNVKKETGNQPFFEFGLQKEKGATAVPSTKFSVNQKHGAKRFYETNPAQIPSVVESTVGFPIVSGSLHPLLDWICSRDSENRGKPATVVSGQDQHTASLYNVRVRKAVFLFEKAKPVTCTLDILGQNGNLTDYATPPTEQQAPLVFRYVEITIKHRNQPITATCKCQKVEVVIENPMYKYKGEYHNLGEPHITGALENGLMELDMASTIVSGKSFGIGLHTSKNDIQTTLQLNHARCSGVSLLSRDQNPDSKEVFDRTQFVLPTSPNIRVTT